jgi:hypothetical protein
MLPVGHFKELMMLLSIALYHKILVPGCFPFSIICDSLITILIDGKIITSINSYVCNQSKRKEV